MTDARRPTRRRPPERRRGLSLAFPRGVLLSAALACAPPVMAGDARDIVFYCPCSAEWRAGSSGDAGQLTLRFGIRSFRATDGAGMRLVPQSPAAPPTAHQSDYGPSRVSPSWPSVGRVPAGTTVPDRRAAMPLDRPEHGAPIKILLYEESGPSSRGWLLHEALTLWPAPDGQAPDRVRFVDMLTDTDGDGVGDANETLAGTSPGDAGDTPGDSVVDILAVHDAAAARELGEDFLFTRIHHALVVTRAMLMDGGTNIRLRRVGTQEMGLTERGYPRNLGAAADATGADLILQFFVANAASPCGRSSAGGCAALGAGPDRGYWTGVGYFLGDVRPVGWAAMGVHAAVSVGVHELGHALGLVHSVRQGEAYGAFRWSRGHYVSPGWGTIMSYGQGVLGGVFSDPDADCPGGPCGVPADEPDGADAARSLDLVRFQVAALRASMPDSDGDGFVDAIDALPRDPLDWRDVDGDGLGDARAPDDDNDGVADADDAFPADPGEWADDDGDGVGDNADGQVPDIAPFRDPALRAAVEAALGKAPGAPIAAAELTALTTLAAPWNAGVRDLAGLELVGNLEVLRLAGNEVEDLSPLAALGRLREAGLGWNRVSDLAPLAGLAALRHLDARANPLSDLEPLAQLPQLESLYVGGTAHRISGSARTLARLTNLTYLHADGVGLADLSFLAASPRLQWLAAPNNPIPDLAPLRELSGLRSVDVEGTMVDDLTPLAGLDLWLLHVGRTGATLDDVLALPNARRITHLSLGGLGIEDASALAEFRQLRDLRLPANRISDVSPLGALPALRSLDLSSNRIADVGPLAGLSGLRYLGLGHNQLENIGPLARRGTWAPAATRPRLVAWGNPLDQAALREHIPQLERWGVTVVGPNSPTIKIRDPVLRALVSGAIAGQGLHVDEPTTAASMRRLWRLHAGNAGVRDLAGLEAATRLSYLYAASNAISDLAPLSGLPRLGGVDLRDNLIADLAPLVANRAIGRGAWLALDGNPLGEASLNEHVPALLRRGVTVRLESVRLRARRDGGAVAYRTSGYFAALLGNGVEVAASSADAGVAAVDVADGTLRFTPGGRTGTAAVTVTATGANGATATLLFLVSFVDPPRALGVVPDAELGAAGDAIEVTLGGLFAGEQPLTFTARSSDPQLVVADVVDGVLVVRSVADGEEGVVTVTVAATDIGGLTATATFEVTVAPAPRGLMRGWRRAWIEQQRGAAGGGDGVEGDG